MAKVLTLLISVAMTWGLVASFGWISLAICFTLALGTLIFSTGVAEVEPARSEINDSTLCFGSTTTQVGSL
jgi:hypothetical protein